MEGLKGFSLLLLVSLGVMLMVVAGAEDAEGATITVPDDYASIQEAIDNATDYDTLFIKDGLYIEAVIVYRPLTIIGESQAGTVIENDDPFAVLMVANRASLSSVTVQGTSVGAGLILQASNCVIEDVTVRDCLWGIWINRAYHNVVRNVQCLNNSWQGVLVEEADETLLQHVTCKENNEGINIRAAVDTTLEDCTMAENRVHGLLVQRLTGFYETEDVKVLNCVISNNGANGIEVTDTDNVTIEGCTVENSGWTAIRLDRCNNIVVRGCEVRNFTRLGIAFQGLGTTRGGIIEDNIVQDTERAWSIVTANGVEDCVIKNNYISCLSAPISIYSANNTLVSDNVVVGTNDNPANYTRGVLVGRHPAGVRLPPTNVTLLRNDVRNFSEGFRVRGGWDIRIIDCTAKGVDAGIIFTVFDFGDDPIVGGVVRGCTFDGCGLVIEGMIDVMVEDNLITGPKVGIYFNATTKEIMANTFTNNTVRDCTEYGMLFNGTNGTNLFHYNTFLNNTEHASDPDPDDDFDDGKYGNFWDDYRQRYPDANIVGVVWDTPYAVAGGTVMDDRPLAYPYDAEAPVADAGGDESELAGELVQFDGTGSTDNVGILNYTWTFMYASTQVKLNGAVASFPFHLIGMYEVDLHVKDAWSNWDNDTVMVEIYDDEAPVADAGDDQNVSMGTLFTLDGGASTDNGLITHYKWVIDPEGLAIMLEGQVVQVSIQDVGEYPVVLSVIDEGHNNDYYEMTVFVMDTEAPVANLGGDFTVDQGVYVDLDGSRSTDNVGIVSWRWGYFDWDETVNLEGEVVSTMFMNVGTWYVGLNVSDAAGNSDTRWINVTVRDAHPPFAEAGEDMEVTAGMPVNFDGSHSQDGEGITGYTWTFAVGGEVVTLTGMEPRYTFNIPWAYLVTLEVEDAAGNVGKDTVTVNVLAVETERQWSLGPFGDEDGPLGGVRVEVVMNGTTHVEYTHDDGFAEFTVTIVDLVSPVDATATKEGWKDLEFDVELGENGDATGTIPLMKKEKGGNGDDDDDDDDIDWLPWSLVIILILAFGGTLLYLSAAAKKAGLDK